MQHMFLECQCGCQALRQVSEKHSEQHVCGLCLLQVYSQVRRKTSNNITQVVQYSRTITVFEKTWTPLPHVHHRLKKVFVVWVHHHHGTKNFN